MGSQSVLWEWHIRLGQNDQAKYHDLPSKIITFAAGFQPKNLAPEICMLLPTTHGAQQISKALNARKNLFKGAATGLLLSDPTIRIDRFVKEMKAAGSDWIINLPTLGLHEAEFISHLNEVKVGPSHEFEKLVQFRNHGIKIIASLADISEANMVATLNPEAVLILPKATAFLNAGPSLNAREQNETAIKAALKKHGWEGPCLGYRGHDEADNAPCVARPVPC